MIVPESPAPPQPEHLLLTIAGDLEKLIAGLGIPGHGSERNFEHHILAIGTGFKSSGSIGAVPGKNMFPVFQVDQGPELLVAPEDNMSPSSTVTSVGTSLTGEFVPVQMG